MNTPATPPRPCCPCVDRSTFGSALHRRPIINPSGRTRRAPPRRTPPAPPPAAPASPAPVPPLAARGAARRQGPIKPFRGLRPGARARAGACRSARPTRRAQRTRSAEPARLPGPGSGPGSRSRLDSGLAACGGLGRFLVYDPPASPGGFRDTARPIGTGPTQSRRVGAGSAASRVLGPGGRGLGLRRDSASGPGPGLRRRAAGPHYT
jgi:hypothetical protein